MVNKIRSEETVVTLKRESNLAGFKLLVFWDDSFANMSGGGSQGGYITFWSDAFGKTLTS